MRRINWALAAIGLGLSSALLGAPSASAATDLIVNGTFETSTSPWWSTGNTPLSVDAGRLRAAVPGGTANRWDAMLGEKQPALTLHVGLSYTLSFDAQASATRKVRTTVQLNAAPYPATLDQLFTVDTTVRHFSFPYTGTLETTNGEIAFQLGGLAGGAYTFWLDNVSLVDNSAGGGGSPIDMTSGFYVDPNSHPAVWVANNSGDSRASQIQALIGSKPMARWFGNWSGDISSAVSGFVGAADTADKLPVLVAYNIPGRDACGGHSGGGAGSPDAYKAWISAFVDAIGARPAVVIIEPDALADFNCMNANTISTRNDMLIYATQQFQSKAPNTWAYLDAGNPGWVPAGTMADRLSNAGLANIRGFSVNISNYYTTTEDMNYGNSVKSSLGSAAKPFVVDTSRNGNGSNGEWCNPAGRKLGVTAQIGGGAEMLLWVKVPGDSDGPCGIAPGVPAGQFSPDLAIQLINGT